MKLMPGLFYEFRTLVVAARPGAELGAKKGDHISAEGVRNDREIGKQIQRGEALSQAERGLDVYTVSRHDAKNLAADVFGNDYIEHGAHEQHFFPHFQPKEHAYKGEESYARQQASTGGGHVFFGIRGERLQKRRAVEQKLKGVAETEKKIKKRHDFSHLNLK